MKRRYQSSRAYFNNLSMVHFALILGQIIFALITALIIEKSKHILDFDLNKILFWSVSLLAILSCSLSKLFFQNRLNSVSAKPDLKDKTSAYFNTFVIRDTLLSLPSFIALIAMLLTNNYIYLFFTLLIVIVMLFSWPTKRKFLRHVSLNLDENALVNNPDAFIAAVTIR